MGENAKFGLPAVALFLVLVVASLALNWFGLFASRPMQKYSEETRAQVYDTSRQYQQGTNRDVARYCYQMSTAPNDSSKQAVAGLIRSTLSTYSGPLSDENEACAVSIHAR